MKQLAQKFGAAKINVLEKMGKRDTTETEEMQNEARKIDDTQHHLKIIYKHLAKAAKIDAASIEENRISASYFKQFGNNLGTNGDHPTLAAVFLALNDLQDHIQDLRTRLDFLVGLRVTEPTKDFVKGKNLHGVANFQGDLKETRLQKKAYDKSRVSYESAQENLKNLEKNPKTNPKTLKEAQEEVEHLKFEHEKCSFETISKMVDTNKKCDLELLSIGCDYIDAYYDFFNKGLQWVSALMPRVEKHREHIQQGKEELLRSQMQRKMTMDETGRVKPKLFGVEIADACKKENTLVPAVVQKSVEFLAENARETEGIFRISGAKGQVDQLRQEFEDGKSPNLNNVVDVHAIAGVLKSYFRELPTPLLTHDLYDQFMTVAEHEQRAEKIQPVVDQLPKPNKETLKTLIYLLNVLSKHDDKNRMNASNLATVLAPNLIYNRDQNPLTMRQEMDQANSIVETMIRYPQKIFTPTKHEPPSVASPRGPNPRQSMMIKPGATVWAKAIVPHED